MMLQNLKKKLIVLQQQINALKGSSGGGGIESIVEGTNITVDDTDPLNPIVSASGGGTTDNTTESHIPYKSSGAFQNSTITQTVGLLTIDNTRVKIGDVSAISKNVMIDIDDSHSSINIGGNNGTGNAVFVCGSTGVPSNKVILGDTNGIGNSTSFTLIDSAKTITLTSVDGLYKLENVPDYADNTAALGGGLTAGFLYRVTGTGQLNIVY